MRTLDVPAPPAVRDGVVEVTPTVGLNVPRSNGSQGLRLVVDWCPDLDCADALEPDFRLDEVPGLPWAELTVLDEIGAAGITKTRSRTFQTNPGRSSFAPIPVRVLLLLPADVDLPDISLPVQTVTAEVLSLAVEATVPEPVVAKPPPPATFKVVFDQTAEAAAPSQPGDALDLSSSQGQSASASERRYVLRILTPTEAGEFEESDNIPLKESKLDLKNLAEKLSDDRYRIYLVDKDGETFVQEFIVIEGKLREVEEVIDVESSDAETAERNGPSHPAPSTQPTLNGPQLDATPTPEGSQEGTQTEPGSSTGPPSTGDRALEFGRARFLRRTGSVAAAGMMCAAHSGKWESAVDAAFRRFGERIPCLRRGPRRLAEKV